MPLSEDSTALLNGTKMKEADGTEQSGTKFQLSKLCTSFYYLDNYILL